MKLAITVPIYLLLLSYCTNASAQTKVLLCTGKYSHSYHKKRCTGLSHCKADIIEVTLESAKNRGKDPCDYCYGPENKSSGASSLLHSSPQRAFSPAQKTTATGQCRALTKKGSRCSRNAGSNGYCWQHG